MSTALHGTMMDYPLTLHTLFERGTRLFPHGEIVTGSTAGSHRTTYAELRRRVYRLASALTWMGIKPGDRVGTFAWNHSRHLELYFAVPMVGAVLHTINIRLFQDQVTYIVNHAEDRWIFADRSFLPLIEQMRPDLPTVEQVVSMDDGTDTPLNGAVDYEALLGAGADTFDFPTVDENDAAMLCYTSGTTGDPKGVAYSHRALVLHSYAACMTDVLGVSERETVMAIVPMFHANAWGLPYACTFVGAKQVFPGVAPQPKTLLGLLQEERVTLAAGVPTVFLGLQPVFASGAIDTSHLKRIVIGGSAAPRAMIEAYDRMGMRIVHAWGMTETTPLGSVANLTSRVAAMDADARMAYRAKQGVPAPGVEARALDPNGDEAPWDGQTMGELVVRGPWVAGSYYNDPRGADRFTADGWFRTGDIVTIDPEGYIEIADRTKDLIKSGGEWISSVALENALMAHPGVAEAAVIAIPDERWGERPLACVVPKPDAKDSLTPEALTEHLASRFARWWLPERYELLEALPKTSVGKFDKKVLRGQFVPVAATAAPGR